ncbi:MULTISPECIES: peptidoglycan-binding domain-containing protein [Calothrix]|uniref:Peptidoglycan-binding protein n=2 Tax=Calothrix TaxID=1186 RepID=A0ABR8A959_9CYAN|nr:MULTISPECIES: peptidoglycan-binding protein [Calothrix]MBD2195596.1 peptidoglycan-binding protein [Calothrix parietina FACHB-288]MBD2224079.1 peptidoglycan-binding protein [Calothrix anomala FACHB-343]
MKIISALPINSDSKVSANSDIVPINFRFWNWTKLSSAVLMRFLSLGITLGIVSIAGQSLALQKFGSNGPEVANIQRCLKKLGYFNGPINSNFGPQTQQAVIAFQQAKKLPADGVVGVGTERSLQQSCQGRVANSNVGGNLRLGSRGPEVVKLQQRLQRLGYFQGPITGYFGPQTQQAYIRYQQGAKVPRNPVVPPRVQPAQFNTPSQGGAYPILSQGSQGPAVTRLQQRLQELGYLNANPTGNFGPLTRDALIAFQSNSGLYANGITDQQTWNRLFNSSTAISPERNSLSSVQIRELQELLREMGYLTANPTGNFGALTRDALIRFQRNYQLPADGIANIQALEAVRAVAQNQSKPIQPGRNYLTVGDSGDNVRAIQERLLQLGFFNGNPDGYYGENTRQYVYAFQQYMRLTPTGNVDPQTWQALWSNNPTEVNGNNNNQKGYVVVIPIHNADTLNKVRQYIANPVVEKSGLGDYVNAGRFSNRAEAENLSKQLRSYGLDARVDYF